MKMEFYFILLVILLNSEIVEFKPTAEECIEDSIKERNGRASLVVTAEVVEVFNAQDEEKYSAAIKVKRVFKGSVVLRNYVAIKQTSRFDDYYNKVVNITGLGNKHICVNSVKIGDTKVFFLVTDVNSRKLRLISSIVHISSYNLNLVDAVIQGMYLPLHEAKFIVLQSTDLSSVIHCYT